MRVQHFFDPQTSSLSYVVFDEARRMGIVIDPVLDFEASTARTSTRSLDALGAFVAETGLNIRYVLDTHTHADHLSGVDELARRLGARSGIGSGITDTQKRFRDFFQLGDEFPVDGRPFDVLLGPDDTLDVGPFSVRALHTPGHTPACMTYAIEDALFVGDTLFMPDYGTARCDFPGGSARELYRSIRGLYDEFPDDTRVFTGHDYQPGGRAVAWKSSIGEQRRHNVQLDDATDEDAYAAFRAERDASLAAPALILPSLQVNLRAGRLPEPEDNGIAYLKIPINALGGTQ